MVKCSGWKINQGSKDVLPLAPRKEILTMFDENVFEEFKKKLINDNEQQYGQEIRAKYGHDSLERANTKIKEMTKAQYAEVEQLSQELNRTLKAAFELGDPRCDLAQRACELHKRWLCFFWDHYSKESHLGVAQMYVDDPRFTAYYDKIMPGCALFLHDALQIFCG
ncbi:MAG: TipAS antibiotic-recognition domain-containing protein [Clostridiales bacterium]|nr:TipAS antibiotic-recognition domain-containing protein [Clostridiales bacterium]